MNIPNIKIRMHEINMRVYLDKSLPEYYRCLIMWRWYDINKNV